MINKLDPNLPHYLTPLLSREFSLSVFIEARGSSIQRIITLPRVHTNPPMLLLPKPTAIILLQEIRSIIEIIQKARLDVLLLLQY